MVSDVNGKVDIPLTKGFLGYLQMVTAPESLPGLMPKIGSYMPPIFADATTTKLVAGKRDVAALAAAHRDGGRRSRERSSGHRLRDVEE